MFGGIRKNAKLSFFFCPILYYSIEKNTLIPKHNIPSKKSESYRKWPKRKTTTRANE